MAAKDDEMAKLREEIRRLQQVVLPLTILSSTTAYQSLRWAIVSFFLNFTLVDLIDRLLVIDWKSS